jgi:hypothetical protein
VTFGIKWIWLALTVGAALPGWAGTEEAVTEKDSAEPADLLARVHFVGTRRIAADPNGLAFTELWELPASVRLEEQTVAKLSMTPFALLQRRAAPGARDYAALFRPMLEDFMRSESFLEISEQGEGFPELTWSVNLNAEQARLWLTNLATAAAAWTSVPIRLSRWAEFRGWEIKKHHPPDLMRVIQAGEWLVMGLGQGQLPVQAATLARIQRTGRPSAPAQDYWLSASLDGPRLSRHFSLPVARQLPLLSVKWFGSGGQPHWDMLVTLPSNSDWRPATWRIPTNLIQGPLMTFSAVQGLHGLNLREHVPGPDWLPLPDQLLAWTVADNPLETYWAAPVANPTNLLEQLAPRIAGAFNTNLHRASVGAIRWQPRDRELVWDGVPFISPFLRIVRDGSDNYLLAGLQRVPMGRSKAAELPPPLIGLTNQVYFDWENTAASLARWRNLSLLLLPLNGKPLMNTDALGARWLEALGPKLGQTSTQVLWHAPNKLQLVRQGMPGLTGFELVTLANWLETTNFPLGGYQVPARKDSRH